MQAGGPARAGLQKGGQPGDAVDVGALCPAGPQRLLPAAAVLLRLQLCWGLQGHVPAARVLLIDWVLLRLCWGLQEQVLLLGWVLAVAGGQGCAQGLQRGLSCCRGQLRMRLPLHKVLHLCS